MRTSRLLSACTAAALASRLCAADSPPLTDEQILKRVNYPADFTATVFASPPNVTAPIFLSAQPDGTVFIGCDENGSLDRKPNRGRVYMCTDTKGTGKADTFSVFATMDSPRGVAWDPSTRTLYVMHPPNLTAYHDDQGTGKADRQEDLITGLGFGLDFRGADHTTNGIRIGIDGWIYIAVGDYGAVKATGKDGRSIAMRGGGIVRVRPDGSGMERVIWGTRNILSVSISPLDEIFTRDNTNDGDDWNDRLSHNPFGAQMGYPILFRNFPEEIIPTMVDYGGGSPVGSVFVDEPFLPKEWAYGFYSVEWGRNEIDLHPLTQVGATYKADIKKLMGLNRATDLEVDGKGNFYAASLDGMTFNYAGPHVGYVIKLTPKNAKAVVVPEFKKLTEAQLVETVASPSGVWRLAAQHELLVRGAKPGVAEGLREIITSNPSLAARVAALFTLKQLLGADATPVLLGYLKNDELREYVLRVLYDDMRIADKIPKEPFVEALTDKNPRVRLHAETGLWHLGKLDAAQSLLPLTADSDYTVAHMAWRSLGLLGASQACLLALDSSDAKIYPGALRALQLMYDPVVVDGLLKRLGTATGELKLGIFKALCRLNFQETPYTDPHMWWGTRPDTSGPIYKPMAWEQTEKIQAALKQQLEAAQGDEAKGYVVALMRHKITFPGLNELMIAKSGKDTSSRLDVIQSLLSDKAPTPADILTALSGIATSAAEKPEMRARAFRLLSQVLEKHGNQVAETYLVLAGAEPPQGALLPVWEEFTRDSRLTHLIGLFKDWAKDKDPARRLLGSTVLVNIVTSTVINDKKQKNEAERGISALWDKEEPVLTLLSVIAKVHATYFGDKVRECLGNSDATVVDAAKNTLVKLGFGKDGKPLGKTIGEMSYEDVVKFALANKGDPVRGQEVFTQQSCVVCHTLSDKEPPKGPMLGGIGQRYKRDELCESILKPSAKIAQGFESQWFRMKNTETVEGFVVKEGGDSVEIRNIVGVTTIIEKANITERQKRDKSIMPEGLVANLPPEDLASLIAFLESTKGN